MARVGILILFLTLEENLSVFTIEYDVNCAFVINNLIYVELYSLNIHLVVSFYHKWILNFVKSFFSIS